MGWSFMTDDGSSSMCKGCKGKVFMMVLVEEKNEI
jgi:hypothetical protein